MADNVVVISDSKFGMLIFARPGAIPSLKELKQRNSTSQRHWQTSIRKFHDDAAEINKLRRFYGDQIKAGSSTSDRTLMERFVQDVLHGKLMVYELTFRDESFFDRYLLPIEKKAKEYNVDPTFIMAIAGESGFADDHPADSHSTYLRTNDAFGQTGGSTTYMTYSTSPTENTNGWFKAWGERIRDSGSDWNLFITRLLGQDETGKKVKGLSPYNIHDSYRGDRKIDLEYIRERLLYYLAAKRLIR